MGCTGSSQSEKKRIQMINHNNQMRNMCNQITTTRQEVNHLKSQMQYNQALNLMPNLISMISQNGSANCQENLRLYLDMGRMNQELNQHEQAIQSFQQALQISDQLYGQNNDISQRVIYPLIQKSQNYTKQNLRQSGYQPSQSPPQCPPQNPPQSISQYPPQCPPQCPPLFSQQQGLPFQKTFQPQQNLQNSCCFSSSQGQGHNCQAGTPKNINRRLSQRQISFSPCEIPCQPQNNCNAQTPKSNCSLELNYFINEYNQQCQDQNDCCSQNQNSCDQQQSNIQIACCAQTPRRNNCNNSRQSSLSPQSPCCPSTPKQRPCCPSTPKQSACCPSTPKSNAFLVCARKGVLKSGTPRQSNSASHCDCDSNRQRDNGCNSTDVYSGRVASPLSHQDLDEMDGSCSNDNDVINIIFNQC